MLRVFPVVLGLCATLVAGSTLRVPPLVTNLRGGEDGSDTAEVKVPPPKALTKEEIMTKLNGVPCFCITNQDGGIVGLSDADGETKSVCWFTDAEEAKAILKAMSDANPDAGLKLTCHGLGGAFTQCNGWGGEESKTAASAGGEEVELRLQGNHQLCKTTAPKLKKLLEDNGFDVGCWQHPVFLCEKLASPQIMPVFLSPRDLAMVWEKSGRDKEDLPKDVTVLDLRMLVSQMQTDANPWSIFHLVASPDSIELAAELTGTKPAQGADGGAEAKVAAAEEEEEEEDAVMV